MSRTAKGRMLLGLMSALIVAIIAGAIVMQAEGNTVVKPDMYYTWGLDNKRISIDVGQIITDVTFTLKGVTHQTDDVTANIEFYLLHNPPCYKPNGQEWVSNIGDLTGDDSPQPSRPVRRGGTVSINSWMPTLIYTYHDNHPGKEDVSFKLSEHNEPDSWVWKIFKSPFDFTLSNSSTVSFTSSVLEFIDYAGTGDSVGILVDPGGAGNFQWDGVEVKIKIETFEGTYVKKEQIVVVDFGNRAPVIF